MPGEYRLGQRAGLGSPTRRPGGPRLSAQAQQLPGGFSIPTALPVAWGPRRKGRGTCTAPTGKEGPRGKEAGPAAPC